MTSSGDVAWVEFDFVMRGMIMSMATFRNAASAFETAYQVLMPGSEEFDVERRGAERHPFRFVQRIAAYDDQDCLARLRFFPVQCYDISRGGLGFLLPSPVGFKRLVVELGDNGRGMYFEGEMVNQRPVADSPLDDMDDVFADLGLGSSPPGAVLIGCRFIRKLELHPA